MSEPEQIGKYVVAKRLGAGGMGTVYLAHDLKAGRAVAIKLLSWEEPSHPAEANNWKALAVRLKNEARILFEMEHPAIVRVYDLDWDESKVWMVMQYVEGVTLQEMLEQGKTPGGSEALAILRQTADALDYAHRKGVIHRDIKPSNLMITPGGIVKVCDFGIAKSAELQQGKTRTGAMTGTLQYMSPEQLTQQPVPASDQWSLAMVAYRMLAGRHPFDDAMEGAQMVARIVMMPIPPANEINPQLSRAVADVLGRALDKNPEKRYSSCSEFVDALHGAFVAAPSEAPAPPRRRTTMWFAGGAIGVAAAILAAVLWFHRPAPDIVPHGGGTSAPVPIPAPPPGRKEVEPPHPPAPKPAEPAKVSVPAIEATLARPGETRINPKDGLKYAWIPAGRFTLGCSPGDNACSPEERPPHPVEISRGFWIGQTEVTQAAFEQVMGNNPAVIKGPDFPVDMVSWREATSYCGKAGLRLPTEAEWEYAARGGSPDARYGAPDTIAWYVANSGEPHPVGGKAPNTYGLYDMLGNVWELTADWFGEKYYAARIARDPKGPARGEEHVMRGLSCRFEAKDLRVSYRVGQATRMQNVGFRCAGDLPADR